VLINFPNKTSGRVLAEVKDQITSVQVAQPLVQLHTNQWKFQRTFQTPLNDLQTFVATIVSVGDQIEAGSLTIDNVVFEPKHLISLLTTHSIVPQYTHAISFTAANQKEVEALLCAALGDWIDFLFVPSRSHF